MKSNSFQKFKGFAVLICVLAATSARTNTLLDFGATPNVTRPSGDQTAANQKLDFHTDIYTGRFNYQVPIEVPPARQGSEPDIALQYNSSVANGWCGVGWDLDMGYIQRETRYGVPVSSGSYSDTFGNSAGFNSFIYSVAGQSGRLIKATDGSYRPEINTAFLKFTYSGGYWTATDKSGRQYTFGDTTGSRIANTTPSGTFKWALSQIVDPNGNTTAITYQAPGDGQLYLSQISYNANNNSPTIAANSTVSFTLDSSRTDVPVSYNSGAKISTTRRLQTITVNNNGSLVRKYVLQYTASPSTGRSLLNSVTEYGADNTSTLPPYTFAYSVQNNSFQSPVNWSIDTQGNNSSAWWNSVGNNDIEMIDVNGDGLPDRVMRKYNNQYTGFYVQLNNGSGFNSTIGWGPIANEQGDGTSTWNSPTYNIIEDLVDINGDLLPDRITQRESSPGLFYVRTNTAVAGTNSAFGSLQSWSVASETTSYSINQMQGVTTTDPSQGFETSVLLTDMNGDGLADRVMLSSSSSQFAVQLNQRGSFAGITHWTGVTSATGANSGPTSYAPRAKDGYTGSSSGGFYADLMDMNGDGLPDRVMIGGVQFNNGYGGFSSLQTWSGLSSGVYPTVISVGDGAHYTILMDMNGDGLPDRVTDNKNGTYSVQINTGSGFSSPVTWTGVSAGGYTPTTGWYAPRAWDANGTRTDMIDMNGDGLPDRVMRGTNGTLKVQISNGPFPDLLTEADNGLGGYVLVSYTNATSFNNSDGTRPRLPMPVYVVTSVNVQDGIRAGGATTYFYGGGLYDTTWREFRGFAVVDEFDPLGTLTQTFFHQGGGLVTGQGQYQDSRFKAGMPYDIITYGSTDGIHYTAYKETLNLVDQVQVDYNGVYFPFVAETFEKDYEATGYPRTTLTIYSYDVTTDNLSASTGNLLVENYQGEVTNVTYAFTYSSVSDPAAPRYTIYAYATITSNPNIIDKPASITISADSGGSTVLQQSLYSYFAVTGDLQQRRDLICPSTYATNSYTVDSYGNTATVTDPIGIVNTISYDSTATFPVRKYIGTLGNNLIDYTQFDPHSGELLAETNEQGLVTANLYDVFFRETNSATSTTPNGSATLWRKQYQYNLGGIASYASQNYVRILENDPANASTGYHETYIYLDGLGRPIQARNQSETSGQYRVTDVFFDPRGNVMAQTYPLLESGSSFNVVSGTLTSTYIIYDPIGRADVFYPFANATYANSYMATYPTPLTGDTGSPVSYTSLSFADGNNPWAIVVTDARGKIHKYELDSQGRTNQIIEVTSSGNYTTKLAYDLIGDLTNITDSASNQTSFFFDDLKNEVAIADPDMGFWQFARDLAGNLKVQTDAKGQQIKFYRADPAGRVTRKEGYTSAGQLVSTNTWLYDTNGGDSSCMVYPGQLYKVTDDEGSQKFSHDVRDRTLKSMRYLSKNGNIYTNQFTFDDADRPSSTIYPNGGPTITNIFDTGEHLSQVKQIGGTNFYTASGFNALEQLTGVNFGNGVGTTLSYYSVSRRLQQIVTAKSSNIQSLTYNFDADDNVTAVGDSVYSSSASAAISSASYSDLNQLISATWSGYGTKNYGYSSIGNVLTNGEFGSGAYNYGTGGIRPHFVRSANGMWFTCDLNGNTVFRGGQRLDYDVNNHLNHVIGTNGIVTTFGSDADGSRLWELSGTNSLQVWIGNNYEEKNGLILFHIYAGDRQVATVDKTGTNVFEYYHPDALASTAIQTDKNGNEIQNYEYSAFGQSRYTQSTNVFKVSRRYTGQVLDDATGLYYYNARYYDPVLARFTQPDTIIPDLSDPQTYNRYAYCVNNPLRYTDPSGKTPLLFDKEAWEALPGWFGGLIIGDTSVHQDPSSYQSLMAQNGTPLLTGLTDANGNKLGNPATAVIKAGGGALLQAGMMMTPIGDERIVAGAAKEGATLLKTAEKEAANASKIDRTAFRAERETFWKTEAKNNSGKYSPENLERMKEGKPPIGSDGYPVELHHVDRTPEGGVQPMTRTDHRLGDNYKKNHPSVKDESK